MVQLTTEQSLVVGRITLKLGGLKINAKFDHMEAGPVVTSYYFNLGFDVPISKILNKAEDFAIAAGVSSVLIYRRDNFIVVEVPNKERQIINFQDCLFSMMTSREGRNFTIPILLGVDTYGRNSFIDLANQPHILIAGSTGGGKSVLLSSIIGALAVSKTEHEVKLTIVDTKRLDLPLFKNLPHISANCETSEHFHIQFDWLFAEVKRRVAKMQGIARNAREWNELGVGEYFAHHVVIIDELADLINQDEASRMYNAGDYAVKWLPVKERLKNLTQICRAAGIHIIAATQRTSVKIISGDIKANFPTRIALRLPTQVDSRTILSQKGAESLLGKGDMLVESLGSDTPQRFHGAFVSNNDIASILSAASQIREQLLALPALK